jgi:hypothetical protein
MESVIAIPLASATYGPALHEAGPDVQAAHAIDAALASVGVAEEQSAERRPIADRLRSSMASSAVASMGMTGGSATPAPSIAIFQHVLAVEPPDQRRLAYPVAEPFLGYTASSVLAIVYAGLFKRQ